MPVTHPDPRGGLAAHHPTESVESPSNERLAELVQQLTSCRRLAALDAVDHAGASGGDPLLIVARAMVGLRPPVRRPNLALRVDRA